LRRRIKFGQRPAGSENYEYQERDGKVANHGASSAAATRRYIFTKLYRDDMRHVKTHSYRIVATTLVIRCNYGLVSGRMILIP
jgi:hypothetical protein